MFKFKVDNKNFSRFATRKKMAGLGYDIDFVIVVNGVIKAECKSITKGKYVPEHPEYWEDEVFPFEADVDFVLDTDIESAEAYYSGIPHKLSNVPIRIEKVKGWAPVYEKMELDPDEDGWEKEDPFEYNDKYWELDKENVVESLRSIFRKGERVTDLFTATMGYVGDFVGYFDEIDFDGCYNPEGWSYYTDAIGGIEKLTEVCIPDEKTVEYINDWCLGNVDDEDEIEYESSRKASFRRNSTRRSSRRESGLRRFAKKPKYTLYYYKVYKKFPTLFKVGNFFLNRFKFAFFKYI